MNEEWLHHIRRRPVSGRQIKIRAGTKMVHNVHKARGGLIRADFEVREGRFRSVHLSGDFFCFPKEAIGWLESKLEAHPVGEVGTVLRRFYAEEKMETPGIGVDDWTKVLEVGGDG